MEERDERLEIKQECDSNEGSEDEQCSADLYEHLVPEVKLEVVEGETVTRVSTRSKQLPNHQTKKGKVKVPNEKKKKQKIEQEDGKKEKFEGKERKAKEKKSILESSDSDDGWKDELPFKCETCERRFPRKRSLWHHKKTHGTPHPCPLCGRAFTLKENLSRHILTHSETKLFHCNLCDKKYSTKSTLAYHMKWHNGVKKYLCHLCSKRYMTSSHLKQHILSHGERVISCQMCDKKFATEQYLKNHINTVHFRRPKPVLEKAGELFSCEFCDKKFYRRVHLASHLSVHTGEMAVDCPSCMVRFSSKSSLSRHLRKNRCKKARELPINSPYARDNE